MWNTISKFRYMRCVGRVKAFRYDTETDEWRAKLCADNCWFVCGHVSNIICDYYYFHITDKCCGLGCWQFWYITGSI